MAHVPTPHVCRGVTSRASAPAGAPGSRLLPGPPLFASRFHLFFRQFPSAFNQGQYVLNQHFSIFYATLSFKASCSCWAAESLPAPSERRSPVVGTSVAFPEVSEDPEATRPRVCRSPLARGGSARGRPPGARLSRGRTSGAGQGAECSCAPGSRLHGKREGGSSPWGRSRSSVPLGERAGQGARALLSPRAALQSRSRVN